MRALFTTAKICTSCGAKKSIEDFSLDGKSDVFRKKICKSCVKDHDTARQTKRKKIGRWHGSINGDRVFVLQEDYTRILEIQDYKCGVCQEPLTDEKRIHLDHDHKTKRIRGILHARCNLGLGYFLDDPSRLIRAATYLMSSDPLAQNQTVCYTS